MMTAISADAFRAAGAAVRVVDTADRRGIENIGRLDVGNVVLGLRHMVEIWRAARRHRPQITLLPISQARLPIIRDALWLVAPHVSGSRIVLHLHGSALGPFRRDAGPLMRALLRWLGGVTWRALVLAEAGRTDFAGMVPDTRIRVLRNAVPDPGILARPGVVPGRFRVVYLANLDPAKGYVDVLDAAERAAPEIPGFELVLAGAWFRGRPEAERRLASPPLRSVARHVGVVTGPAKADLLAGADLFVFPPRQREGQPLVLLEAMAAGLPIVSTPSGFIPDTVAAGENAILVPPADPEALARAFRTLHGDRDRLREMGDASRARYLQYFTPDRLTERLAALVRELNGATTQTAAQERL